jgi:protein TonB
VYKDGKMIFRQPNQPPRQPSLAVSSATIQLSPEVANTYLTHRVEPDYPERARHQHIQGPVVLHAIVSEEGAVQELKVLSGDSQLASAAIDAVRLWKFKPYLTRGRHSQFETQITVNFALPASAPVNN